MVQTVAALPPRPTAHPQLACPRGSRTEVSLCDHACGLYVLASGSYKANDATL